jgi:hypothetical protein
VIEKLQRSEGSSTDALSFQSQGMTISLAMTCLFGDRKYLSVKVGNVGIAVLTTDGTTATWNTSLEAEVRNDAGASTTLDGAAPPVIENITGDTQDG